MSFSLLPMPTSLTLYRSGVIVVVVNDKIYKTKKFDEHCLIITGWQNSIRQTIPVQCLKTIQKYETWQTEQNGQSLTKQYMQPRHANQEIDTSGH